MSCVLRFLLGRCLRVFGVVICSFLWLCACVHGVGFDWAWILRVSMGRRVGGCVWVFTVFTVFGVDCACEYLDAGCVLVSQCITCLRSTFRAWCDSYGGRERGVCMWGGGGL